MKITDEIANGIKPLPKCMKILEAININKRTTCIKVSIHEIIYNIFVGSGGGYVEIEGNDELRIYCNRIEIEENKYVDNQKELVFRSNNGDKVASVFLEK